MENNILSLTPLPSSLESLIAIDVSSGKVYADKKISGDPILLTWLDRNRRNGHKIVIVPKEVDEIAQMRARGLRMDDDQDASMKVKGDAIAMLRLAAQYGASDLHINMPGTHAELQLVVDGSLRVLRKMTQDEGAAMVLAIYQGIATTKDASFNPLEAQNAQIAGEDLPTDISVTSIRIVRGPCYPQARNGSFMTLRFQYAPNHKVTPGLPSLPPPKSPEGQLKLESMGYTKAQVDKIRLLLEAPNGLVVFTGPTGSGKTTAMYEALKEAARISPGRRLVTAEDPVEYPMEWAIQLAITNARTTEDTATAFAAMARTMLRMAPNVIQLGEIRDAKVALTALEMAVTGHQVWTTMHVNDPYLSVDRMELMDAVRLNRRIFCDHKIIRGIIAQRLIKKLCPHCSLPFRQHPNILPERLVSRLETWGSLDGLRLHNPKGCAQCGGNGTVGRFAVAEIVVTNASLMADFIEKGSEAARVNHRRLPDSDPSMLETAIRHALNGVVDPRHIQESIDLIEPKETDIEQRRAPRRATDFAPEKITSAVSEALEQDTSLRYIKEQVDAMVHQAPHVAQPDPVPEVIQGADDTGGHGSVLASAPEVAHPEHTERTEEILPALEPATQPPVEPETSPVPAPTPVPAPPQVPAQPAPTPAPTPAPSILNRPLPGSGTPRTGTTPAPSAAAKKPWYHK